ncbi:hypothetical protein chiPu_0006029 [Chiloscyllium punctatum]|uniref:Murine leukemia virus integrase C-terminal domain-containing protein n=1 Tax=Chiloscyllium punctatum TaxID=137246 RepID=A0A401SB83_CHIPU|nr:hypothetical protein [Chiloscyllium punctatum]
MKLRATTNQATGLTPSELMTGRAMQLPETIITGGTDVGPLKDKIRRYVIELSAQLKVMQKSVIDTQDKKDKAGELEIFPEIPAAGILALVRVLPDKPGFAPKWNGPYDMVINGDTWACRDIKGKGTWKHWTQLKPFKDSCDQTNVIDHSPGADRNGGQDGHPGGSTENIRKQTIQHDCTS